MTPRDSQTMPKRKTDDSTSEIEISDDGGGSDVPKPKKSKKSKTVKEKAEKPKVSVFRETRSATRA